MTQPVPPSKRLYSHVVDINRMATHPDEDFARIPVDIGQTGLTVGHTFRVAREIILGTSASLWWRFTSPVDFALQEQFFTGDVGFYIFKVYAASNVNASADETWNIPVPMFGKNRSSERPTPFYEQQSSMMRGGTATIIDASQYVDVARVKSASATAQQTTVGAGISSERLLPAGTYYLNWVDQAAGGAGSAGAYYLTVEERP